MSAEEKTNDKAHTGWHELDEILPIKNERAEYFRIPRYQRNYCWGKDQVRDLFSELNGRLKEKKSNDVLFLGTLILVETSEENSDPPKPKPLEVIDGQQRLTTIMLILTDLHNKVRVTYADVTNSADKDGFRFDQEFKELDGLTCLVMEKFQALKKSRPVIRHEGYDDDPNQPGSVIARYLNNDKLEDRDFENVERRGSKALRIAKDTVEKEINNIANNPDIGLHEIANHKFNSLSDDKKKRIEQLSRLVYLTQYLLESLTLVNFRITPEYGAKAYQIFDRLNTTGQALTAIDILKAEVISRAEEDTIQEFKDLFQDIEEAIQKEAKNKSPKHEELIISTAYYSDGKSPPKKPSKDQYRWIKDKRKELSSDEDIKSFMTDMKDIARYRCTEWQGEIADGFITEEMQQVKGCLKICLEAISKNTTELSIPILTHYRYGQASDPWDFVAATMIFTGFLFIRRFQQSPGGTTDIDTVFKKLLEEQADAKEKFRVADLKEFFMKKLEKSDFYKDKNTWKERVKEKSLKHPHIFFYMHYAQEQAKGNVEDKDYLREMNQLSEQKANATIEHIAPKKGKYWLDSDAYEDKALVEYIGNKTLLAAKSNATVSNAPWGIKKLYYQSLTLPKTEVDKRDMEGELNAVLKQIKGDGIKYPTKAATLSRHFKAMAKKSLIITVDDIYKHSQWGKKEIEARQEAILDTSWEMLNHWVEDIDPETLKEHLSN